MQNPRRLHGSFKSLFAVVAITGLFPAEKGGAQCTTAPIENMAESAGAQKYGYVFCTPTNSPIIHYYLVDTHIRYETAWYSAVDWIGFQYVQNWKYVETVNPLNGTNYPTVSSGTASGKTWCNEDNCNGSSASGSITNALTGQWDAGGTTANNTYQQLIMNEFNGYYAVGTNICSQTLNENMWTIAYGDDSVSETAYYTDSDMLSFEFSDSMLRGYMLQAIPPYPPEDPPSNWSWGSGTAFYAQTVDHSQCSGGRMKYRFWLCDQNSTQQGQQFRLDWTQTTTYPGTNQPPLTQQMSGIVTGDGGSSGIYVLEHSVDVPGTPCTITESDATVTPISSSGDGSAAGSGGPGSGVSGGK